MLRLVIAENFIHFQEQTKFEFHAGPNFLIGQNCSGKTSVFEASRRCLGLGQNTSFSSSHFRNKISFTACVFDIEKENNVKGKLLSTAIRIPSTDSSLKNNTVCIKFSFETIAGAFGIDLVKEAESGYLVNERVELQEKDTIKCLCNNFLENPLGEHLDTLIKALEESVHDKVENFKSDDSISEVNDTDCEKILRRYLDETVVFTFSVRGIGPLQWSKSDRVRNACKKENYEIAQERSEILRWYLSGKKSGDISNEDQSNVDKYFAIITDNCGLQFRYEWNAKTNKSELVAQYSNAGKRGLDEDEPKTFPVLKVPEGFLEAMDTSILLGVSNFKTVCLEEPEKGMNPQMIERMRDLVLQRMKNKTVLITSHHPFFLGPWTVPKLYIFKRTENGNGIRFSVYAGSDIEPDGSDKKSPRIITSDKFAAIFFARRVMFVEGEGDYLFMTSLKQLLLTDDELALQLIKHGRKELERLRVFLCSLHILNIGGETNKLRLNKLCSKIDMERYFLLDYDAIEDDKETAEPFLKDFNLDTAKFANVLGNVDMLETEGLFVWNKTVKDNRKTGKIEDAFIQLTKHNSGLKEFFNRKNVLLNYEQKGKLKNRNKLFLHKDLTDENIRDVVHKVIECCVRDKKNNKSTEMLRLVNFLSNISQLHMESSSQ